MKNYLEETIRKLKNEHHELNGNKKSVFNIDAPETFKVNIRPSKTVRIGVFKQDPLIPNGYIAHPDTIKAMRKDIFVAENDIDFTEELYQCENCKENLDKQFWLYCPYCGTKFRQ